MWSRSDPDSDDLSSPSSSTSNLSRSPSRGSIRAIIPPNAFAHQQAPLANQMAANNKPPTRISSIAKSIDSILDAPASPQNSPPKLNRPTVRLRPSWIGPPRVERPPTPGITAMKQPVVIDFASPGLVPPVYVSTNMSDPAWEPVKMQAVKQHSDGTWRFHKSFDVEEGEYQYKFRLGEGDWWECDTAKPLVDDGYGNKNNLVVVKPYEKRLENPPIPLSSPALPAVPNTTAAAFDSAAPKPPALLMPPQPAHLAQPVETPVIEVTPHPGLKHEMLVDQSSASEHTPEVEEPGPDSFGLGDDPDAGEVSMKMEERASDVEEDESSSSSSSSSSTYEEPESHQPPMLPHEQLAPKPPARPSKAIPTSTSLAPAPKTASSAYNESDPHQPPLLPHEQLTPISPVQASKPGPKSTPRAAVTDVPSAYKPHLKPVIPQEADPNDPSLEQFPKDYAGIVSLMRRLSQPDNNVASSSSPLSLATHGYSDPHNNSTMTASQASTESFGSNSTNTLPSVPESEAETEENDEERLEGIREWEEEEDEDEEEGSDFPITEPEDAGFDPRYSSTPNPKAGPAMEKIRRRVVAELNDDDGKKGMNNKKQRKQHQQEPEDRVVALLGGRNRAV